MDIYPGWTIHSKKIKDFIPNPVYKELPEVTIRFQICTPLRLAHFLAQCAHESRNFEVTSENLNYSASGLLKTFGKYFDVDTSERYARNPEAIASRVYANRMGNGDEKSRDGWNYRGRGYIQLTGWGNYLSFDAMVIEDILEYPDLVATKYPLLSAGWFWNKNRINDIADRGATDEVVTLITKKVNGGTHGLDERCKYFSRFYDVLVDK